MDHSKTFSKNLKKRDILILSAFGRGHWLASVLSQSLKLKVTLVDVSKHLGHWGPEDWEGPFGLFRTSQLKNTQLERLDEEDYSESVDQGFTVWLKKGPIELKSSLTSYLLENWNVSQNTQKYLKSYEHLSFEQKRDSSSHLLKMGFKRIWLAHFAHHVASTSYSSNTMGLEFGDPLPLFSPYYVRRVSRRGYEKSLKWCESMGVEVFRSARLKDIQGSRQKCESIEIEDGRSRLLISKKFIWMLSSEETSFLNPSFAQFFYLRNAIRPTWAWVRFRIRLSQKRRFFEALPLKFIVIEELNLPWTHSNLGFVEKTVREQDFDVWLRIPCEQRFQKAYLENVAHSFLEILKKRLIGSGIEILNMPQDHLYDYSQLGPPRHPVYEVSDLKRLRRYLSRRWKTKNVDFDGPEYWSRLDWTGRFYYQNSLFEKMKKWAMTEKKDLSQGDFY